MRPEERHRAYLIYYSDLNPICFFCGESEEIFLEQYEHTAGKRWRIVCCSCMAQIDRGHDQTPGILIDLWNARK